MNQPSQHFVQCQGPAGLHRMAYVEWGDQDNPQVLVCVHGLTRCGRDFDNLARALCRQFRVICPDVVGRGLSDWLTNPAYYNITYYVPDMVTLLARLDVEAVSWLGTSLGGMIGMGLAAQKNAPIRKLILNDVGPLLNVAAIKRIGAYLGQAPRFASLDAAVSFTKNISASFGNLTDEQWRALTLPTVRVATDGKVEFRYDPRIAETYNTALNTGRDVALWPFYDAIHCPTLAIRGADSDLISHATHAEMGQRGPRAQLVEIPHVGHAPMFQDEAQICIVRDFLLA